MGCDLGLRGVWLPVVSITVVREASACARREYCSGAQIERLCQS